MREDGECAQMLGRTVALARPAYRSVQALQPMPPRRTDTAAADASPADAREKEGPIEM